MANDLDVGEAGKAARSVIPTVIRALMAAHRVTGPQLAAVIGISPSSLYARLNGKSEISAPEVAQLSAFFEVPAQFFYNPPKGLLRNRCSSWQRFDLAIPA
jgi:transcriptional regulator with XRE-family HTH domain